MPFLPPNQQRQSTEGIKFYDWFYLSGTMHHANTTLGKGVLQDNSEEISWLNKTERTQKPFKKQHSYLVNVPACKHAANICSAVI